MSRFAAAVVCVSLAWSAASACGSKEAPEPAPPPDIDGLAALGEGVRVVVGGDFDKLVASRLVRRAVEAMLARDLELKGRVDSIVSECKLEPGENLESFLIGLGDGPTDLLLVVSGKFEENALTACVQKRMIDAGGRLATKAFGARTTYRAESGSSDPVWFALGSPRTLIVAGSEAWLHNGLGKGPRFTDDAASRQLIAAASSGQATERTIDSAMWATGFIPDSAAGLLVSATKGAIKRPLSMMAGLDFEAGIQGTLIAEMASEADAKTLKSIHSMQKVALVAVAQAKGLGNLVNQLTIEAEGKTLKIGLKADEKTLSELFATVDSATPTPQNPPSPEARTELDGGHKSVPERVPDEQVRQGD